MDGHRHPFEQFEVCFVALDALNEHLKTHDDEYLLVHRTVEFLALSTYVAYAVPTVSVVEAAMAPVVEAASAPVAQEHGLQGEPSTLTVSGDIRTSVDN